MAKSVEHPREPSPEGFRDLSPDQDGFINIQIVPVSQEHLQELKEYFEELIDSMERLDHLSNSD